MKKFLVATLFCLIISICFTVSGQTKNLYLLFDTTKKVNQPTILLIFSTETNFKGVEIKNYAKYVKYRGKILDQQDNEYMIFSSFSEPTGSIYYYLFDIRLKNIYMSQAVQDVEIPYIFSFDKDAMSMIKVLTAPPNCGKRLNLAFSNMQLEDFEFGIFKKCKLVLKIKI